MLNHRNSRGWQIYILPLLLVFSAGAWAQDTTVPSTADRPMHEESAAQHENSTHPAPHLEPAIPEGMTLDDVFRFSESPPPANFPEPAPDDRRYAFLLFDQLEYRLVNDDETDDHLGWEAQGWVGGDFHKFWWKNEGEAVFDGTDEGEMETDLLYSRLITPFWNFQLGVQYANTWGEGDSEDRWSGVIALQGLAPYKFELDNSLYISEDGDYTLEFEAEYDLRITQRLVLQPLLAMDFAFQDTPERNLGTGMSSLKFDLRLRYEIKRELAPYLGLRSSYLVGETGDIAEASGQDTEQLYFMAGVRLAF